MTHVCARTSRANFETKIVRQSQEIKQEEVEVKVPRDKNPENMYVVWDYDDDMFAAEVKPELIYDP